MSMSTSPRTGTRTPRNTRAKHILCAATAATVLAAGLSATPAGAALPTASAAAAPAAAKLAAAGRYNSRRQPVTTR